MYLRRFRRWALTTTIATYLLIAVGGIVRAQEAGLGCPDWPKCFERWIPPFSVEDVPPSIDKSLFNVEKAWTEYINRLLGVLVGFFILFTLFYAHRIPRADKSIRRKPILYLSWAAAILVLIEGWIGGQVVAHHLRPLILTIHLVFALGIALSLAFATLLAWEDEHSLDAHHFNMNISIDRKSKGLWFVCLFLFLCQMSLGAYLRGIIQEVPDEIVRSDWFAFAGLPARLHKMFAFVPVSFFTVLYLLVYSQVPKVSRRFLDAAAVVCALQIAAGVSLASYDFPRLAQVLHLWFAVLFLSLLFIFGFLVDCFGLRARRVLQ